MSKVRAARDEGKRAWIYKGKVVIARDLDLLPKQSSKMVIKKRQQTL
jgi:hypothetical protein